MQGFGIRHTVNPNPYTGAFGNDGKKYAEDVRDVIRTSTPGGVAGFIAETIQGVGGTVPLADGYLPAVYDVSFSFSCILQLILAMFLLLAFIWIKAVAQHISVATVMHCHIYGISLGT
jgi:hypothetical protein